MYVKVCECMCVCARARMFMYVCVEREGGKRSSMSERERIGGSVYGERVAESE